MESMLYDIYKEHLKSLSSIGAQLKNINSTLQSILEYQKKNEQQVVIVSEFDLPSLKEAMLEE